MNIDPPQDHFHLHAHECSFGNSPEVRHDDIAQTARSRDRARLLAALGITLAIMAAEFVGGWWAGSLALIGDAGHMLADAMALGVSLLAILAASRPPTQKISFGFHRLEILAALFNGFILSLLTIWILVEATRRIANPQPVAGRWMLWIGLLGLVANCVAAMILRTGRRVSLNLQSAYLHVLGDAFSSLGVVVAALIITRTGWTLIDPLLSIVLTLVILFSTFKLIRDAVNILLEASPSKIDGPALIDTLKVIEEVQDVHDVHIWTLASGLYAFSAHIAIPDIPVSQTSRLLKRINFVLCQKHGIGHTAIQFETKLARESNESRRD